MARHAGDALYYPYIHVRDAGWLKMALLYWESITRILPPSYQPHDDVYGTKEAVDAGLIHGISPGEFLDAAARRFREEFLSTDSRHDVKQLWQTLDKAQRHEVIDVHPGKLDPTLLRDLVEMRLAAPRRDQDVDMNHDVNVAANV